MDTAEVSSPLTEFQLEDLLNQQPPLDVRRSVIHPKTLLLLQRSQSAHFFHSFLLSIPFYFTPSCCHPPSPSPLRESNHSSSANQKEEEPLSTTVEICHLGADVTSHVVGREEE